MFNSAVPDSLTLGQLGRIKLSDLCEAVECESLTPEAIDTFDCLSASWSERATRGEIWPCDITDDGTPFEFSVAFEGERAEVRMLAEAQGANPSLEEQWRAGVDLTRRLSQRFGADISRFERIAELFRPRLGNQGHFALWHGVTVRAFPGAPDFKVYLNPQIRGAGEAATLVSQALSALGLEHASTFVQNYDTQRDGKARPLYLSLDLAADAAARVKLYFAHDAASPHDLDWLLSRCKNAQPDDLKTWCRAVLGSVGPFLERPLLSCVAFTSGEPKPTGTLHMPARCYVANDALLAQRVSRLLDDRAAALYLSALSAVASGPLACGRGLQTYVSLRRVEGAPRLTVYLAPEAYSLRSRRRYSGLAPRMGDASDAAVRSA